MKKLSLIILLFSVFILSGFLFMDKSYFLCPVEYKNGIVVRSDGRGDGFFGAERSGRRLHNGIDLLAKVGTPVLASRSGRVIAAKQNRGMGKYVIIKHRHNITTVYGHLSEICIRKNARVRQGQVVGKVGRTGNARYAGIQPHLHFEVKKRGVPQDPLDYLKRK